MTPGREALIWKLEENNSIKFMNHTWKNEADMERCWCCLSECAALRVFNYVHQSLPLEQKENSGAEKTDTGIWKLSRGRVSQFNHTDFSFKDPHITTRQYEHCDMLRLE